VISVAAFAFDTLPAMAGLAAATLALLIPCPAPFRAETLRALRPLWPFLALLVIFHLVTRQAVEGAALALRLLAMVTLANLVTMTTTLDALLAVATRLLSPLRPLGIKPGRIAFAALIVIRQVPTLLARARQLSEAWRARSRRRPGWQIVFPLCLATLDEADHLADALRARGGIPD